jgi:hypothetical protein
LIRTGIWHLLNAKPDQDPIDMRSLQVALSQFCLIYLKGNIVEGIDLATAPGIADLLIWSYCSDKRYNICGKIPKCSGCKLEKTCLLGVVNTQRVIDKQRTSVCETKESEDAQISNLPPSGASMTADSTNHSIQNIPVDLPALKLTTGDYFKGTINDEHNKDGAGWHRRSIGVPRDKARGYPEVGDIITVIDIDGKKYTSKFTKSWHHNNVCLGQPSKLKGWYTKYYPFESVASDEVYFEYTGCSREFKIYISKDWHYKGNKH